MCSHKKHLRRFYVPVGLKVSANERQKKKHLRRFYVPVGLKVSANERQATKDTAAPVRGSSRLKGEIINKHLTRFYVPILLLLQEKKSAQTLIPTSFEGELRRGEGWC